MIFTNENKQNLCWVKISVNKCPYTTLGQLSFHQSVSLIDKKNVSALFQWIGNLCMITGGRNLGRVGTVVNRERHPGSFDIVHIKDAQGHVFATRLSNVFIIGKGTKAYVSLPKGKGIKLSIAEERDKRLAAKSAH